MAGNSNSWREAIAASFGSFGFDRYHSHLPANHSNHNKTLQKDTSIHHDLHHRPSGIWLGSTRRRVRINIISFGLLIVVCLSNDAPSPAARRPFDLHDFLYRLSHSWTVPSCYIAITPETLLTPSLLFPPSSFFTTTSSSSLSFCSVAPVITSMYLSGFVMKARKEYDVQYPNLYGEY